VVHPQNRPRHDTLVTPTITAHFHTNTSAPSAPNR
jgi:hypothetical protein